MKPGDIIFLSASVPKREGWMENAKPAEIEEAVVSLARAVFARQGRLLFGGHPSISPLIAAVAGEYFPVDPNRVVRPVITFQSEHFRGRLPDETWDLYRMGWASIEWTPDVQGKDEAETRQASLAVMRHWMLMGPETPANVIARCELHPPRAMVAIGGMEGVCDEAAVFLRHVDWWTLPERPHIFLIASGGGAAALLARATSGQMAGPVTKTLDPTDRAMLVQARREGRLQVLEEIWEQQAHGPPGETSPFHPYAAMAQWLLDTVR